jgi:hypothetical protein
MARNDLEGIVSEILDRAGIDYGLLKNPDHVIQTAIDCFDKVMLKWAAGDASRPLTAEERRQLLNEVADELIRELHRQLNKFY